MLEICHLIHEITIAINNRVNLLLHIQRIKDFTKYEMMY